MEFLEKIVDEHYLSKHLAADYEKRGRQVNISLSIETFAMLKAQSEHFGYTLSSYCATILDDAIYSVLKRVSANDGADVKALVAAALKETKNEYSKIGEQLPMWTRWDMFSEEKQQQIADYQSSIGNGESQ